MASRKTCDKCKYYTANKHPHLWPYDGNCSNPNFICDGNSVGEPNQIMGGGYDGYGDYITMGPKFGCIHWEKK